MSVKESVSRKNCISRLMSSKSPKTSISNLAKEKVSVIDKNRSLSQYKRNIKSGTANSRALKKVDEVANICSCSLCLQIKDIPDEFIQNLQNQEQALRDELNYMQGKNQSLRREIGVAKKVVVREIGGNCLEFETLIESFNKNDIVGKQKLAIELKNNLQELTKMIEQFENGNGYTKPKKNLHNQDANSDDIDEDRKLYWCLEFERRAAQKVADRFKMKLLSCRDSLKKRTDSLIARNAKMTEEVSQLRKTLTEMPRSEEDGISDRLKRIQRDLRSNLAGKSEQHKRLSDMEAQICCNTRAIMAARSKINLEKQKHRNQEKMITALAAKKETLKESAEEAKKIVAKEETATKKKLLEVQSIYEKLMEKLSKVLKPSDRSSWVIKNTCNFSLKEYDGYLKAQERLNISFLTESEGYLAAVGDNVSSLSIQLIGFLKLKNEFIRYSTLYDEKLRSNKRMTDKLYAMINTENAARRVLMRKDGKLRKLYTDVNLLRHSIKNLKDSMEVAESGKEKEQERDVTDAVESCLVQLNVLKIEQVFLKTLIEATTSCKKEDFDLCMFWVKVLRTRFANDLYKALSVKQ